jgi:hydroxyacylglutathione hydrolase
VVGPQVRAPSGESRRPRLIFRRLFEPKLAQASYLIGCPATRRAVVVDPNRDIDRYLQTARDEGLRITDVTETHIHADFVSGARELAQRSGARLHLSRAGDSEWGYRYPSDAGVCWLADESAIELGRIELRALHVPGHTPEHLTFLVSDREKGGEPMGALTGDFVFVGDVGRPDLLERAVRAKGTMEQAARQLFQSLQRFRSFQDYLQLWPGHGAGSACGKSLSAVPQSTLGFEKRFNWAFGVADEAEFVRAVLAGQPEPPPYFARMKQINQAGPSLLGSRSPPPRQSLERLAVLLADGGVVVDTREPDDFGRASIPGTINIPANRSFTNWAGSLLPYDQDLYLLGDDRTGMIDRLTQDLAGIGLERVAGYFPVGIIDEWRSSRRNLQRIPLVTVDELARDFRQNGSVVIDVRREGEWKVGHLPGSLNLPLSQLDQRLEQIPRDSPLVVHCQSGSRAAIGASLLLARGFSDVRLFPGGFAEWRAAGHVVEVQ